MRSRTRPQIRGLTQVFAKGKRYCFLADIRFVNRITKSSKRFVGDRRKHNIIHKKDPLSFEILWIFRSNNHFAWWFMVFNATLNNISVISWWSALLVDKTGVPGSTRSW